MTITAQLADLFPDDDPEPPVSLAAQALSPEPVTISAQASVIELVGAEGYIHGFICVRPPCGDKPKKIQPYDLIAQKDGGVVHRLSGYSVGHVAQDADGTWTATHADGVKGQAHKSRPDAVREISQRYNSGKTQAALSGSPQPPKTSKAASPARPPVKPPPAKPAISRPAVAPAAGPAKPAAAAPKPPAPPGAGGPERSGTSVWKTDEGTADLTPGEKKAIANTWYNKNFINTQDWLRRGTLSYGSYYGLNSEADADKFKADVATFRKAVSKAAPFKSDVTLLRGVNNPEGVFGPVGSLTGKSFKDKGFTSATSNLSVGQSYSKGFGGKTALITIHARKGTRALKVDPQVWAASHPRKGQTPPEVLQEYTLAPDTPYRILSDTLGPDGVRRMDLEVAP